jgi:acyl-coenzyme A thioesterase PaaI-like protein
MSEQARYDPLTHVAQPDQPDAEAEARAGLGRAIRDLGHAVSGHHVPLSLLTQATSTVRGLVDRFEEGSRRDRTELALKHFRATPSPPDGGELSGHDERPISGRASPWGLDPRIIRDGDEAVAHITLRSAHEGAPGRSHGGIVAALLDDICGFVLTIHARPAYTGELTIRYQAGTPIGVPLECRCRLDRSEGRKMYISGELTAAGEVVARVRGLFLAIESAQFLSGD